MKITGVRLEAAGDCVPRIRGVGVFHVPTPYAATVRVRLETNRPVVRAPGGPVHIELLDWGAIVTRTNVFRNGPAPTPSDLAHLPSTAEELLVAYLSVVGVRSQDCYNASVTVTQLRSISGTGPKMPTSDGEARHRHLHGDTVVVAYRDGPDYAAGQLRWAAYQRDVLMARLDHLSAHRDPVHPPPPGWERALVRIEKVFHFFDGEAAEGQDRSPHPYCCLR